MKFDKSSWVCVPPVVVDHRVGLGGCLPRFADCAGWRAGFGGCRGRFVGWRGHWV